MFDYDAPPEKPNPEFQAMKDRMAKMEARLEKVEGYQRECDDLHKKNEEQSKLNDDAIKNNTESNILATKSINELSVVITESVAELNNNISQLAIQVKSHEPAVKEWTDFGTAWSINKKILFGLSAIAVAITSIAASIKYFFY